MATKKTDKICRRDKHNKSNRNRRANLANLQHIHWKEMLIGGVVSVLLIVVDCLDNKKPSEELYSESWFGHATDEELINGREKVRLEFCASGGNRDEAIQKQHLLDRFDEEMRRRERVDEEPGRLCVPREHGWYSPNDD